MANNNIVELENKIYIEDVKINLDGYDAKIIGFENIDGFAKCIDIGADYIVYEKEGQTLSEYIINNKLSANDLINFINDLYKATKSFENYLLPDDNIYLSLNSVIINNHHFEFLAVPENHQDFNFELSKLIIRMLRGIDVEDKNALSIGYDLFVRSSKDDYTLSDLTEDLGIKKYA